MTKKGKSTIADSIPNDACWTIEEIADDFGLSHLRTRQVVDQAIQKQLVQNLTKKEGRRILYAPQMVEQLQNAKEKGILGKFNKKREKGSSMKDAKLVLNVAIFDSEIAELLLRKFQSEDAIIKHVKDGLEASVKTVLAKKKELAEKYERAMQELLSNSSTFEQQEVGL